MKDMKKFNNLFFAVSAVRLLRKVTISKHTEHEIIIKV